MLSDINIQFSRFDTCGKSHGGCGALRLLNKNETPARGNSILWRIKNGKRINSVNSHVLKPPHRSSSVRSFVFRIQKRGQKRSCRPIQFMHGAFLLRNYDSTEFIAVFMYF